MKEGRGIGTLISESLIFILLGAALLGAGYWYFFINMRSPEYAMGRFLGSVNSGNNETQYRMLAESTRKRFYPTEQAYDKEFPLAHGLAARVARTDIVTLKSAPDRWEGEVRIVVRKTGEESLLQAGTEEYKDRYVLRREADGWKVVLEESKLESLKAVSRR
jgi:hypothetical protein